MFDQITHLAAAEGLDYDFDRVVVANSFAGHELIHLARAHDAAQAYGIQGVPYGQAGGPEGC